MVEDSTSEVTMAAMTNPDEKAMHKNISARAKAMFWIATP